MDNQRKQQARQIFMEIIDLPDGPQHSKLDELCGDNTPLKLDIEALLLAHQQAKNFMANPTASGHSAPITEKPGTVIGPYKLLQQIGEGGFGTVFLAEQSKPIRRRVALKIIKLGMDTKQVIARFEAERQALALMDHPNIARVLDAGATETGRPYFVMEYVVGDSVTEFADAHKLSVPERLALFNQVCAAVQHAHTKGVIHRDIKPSNILVSMTDGKPLAKVIDFGIAKATATPLTEKTLFTEHHQLIGTLQYMSPEQAEGLPDIDTRTDVYALGVLLYELLTGQTPIDGKRLRSAAWNEIRRIIKEEEPPAPSMSLSRNVCKLAEVASARQADPSKLSAILRGELDWITIKALDKDRARRYETPSALAADVQRHLDGDAVVAAPVSRGYKMRKFVQRNKGMVIAVSAVAAALLVGIATTTWQWREAKQANTAVAKQADDLREAMIEIGNAAENAASRGGPSFADETDPDNTFPGMTLRNDGGFSYAPNNSIEGLRDKTIWYIDYSARVGTKLQEKTDTAEWSSYTANLALAQMAMDNGNWPKARKRIAACPKSKRGWEWEFLSNKAESVIAEFRDISSTVSPDGRQILTWNWKKPFVKLYDLDGNLLKEYVVADAGGIWHGTFSADGSSILLRIRSPDLQRNYCQVFDVPGGVKGPFNSTPVVGEPAAFAPDGSSFVAIAETARLYDNSGHPIASLEEVETTIRGAHTIYSPDGSLIAAATHQGIKIWNSDGTPISLLAADGWNWEDHFLFSPDGSRIASASGNTVSIWTTDGELASQFVAGTTRIRNLRYVPDSSTLITAHDNGLFKAWDASGLIDEVLLTYSDESSCAFCSYRFISDGENMLFITNQSWSTEHVTRWRIGEPVVRWSVYDPRGGFNPYPKFDEDQSSLLFADGTQYMRFDLDGNLMQSGSSSIREGDNSTALIMPLTPDRYLGGWEDLESGAMAIGMLPLKHTHYRTGPRYELGTLFASSITSKPPLDQPPAHIDAFTEAEAHTLDPAADAWLLLPDSSRIVTASKRSVRFWDTETSRELIVIPMSNDTASLGISPDAKRLVIQLVDGSVEVLDIRSPEQQTADTKRRWAERKPAGEYLDTLMAGPTPTDDLMSAIESAPSLTPLRRLAAAELLLERLSDIEARSSRKFEALSKDQTDKATVLAAAQVADLPPRVKERVLAKAQEWEYKPPRVSTKEQLVKAEMTVQLTQEQLEFKVEELNAVLSVVDKVLRSIQNDAGARVSVKQMLDSYATRVVDLDIAYPHASARARQTLSLAYLGLDEYELALAQAQAAVSLLCDVNEPGDSKAERFAARLHTIGVQSRLGTHYKEQGKYNLGNTVSMEALSDCEELIVELELTCPESALLAHALYRYGRILPVGTRSDDAIAAYKRAANLCALADMAAVPSVLLRIEREAHDLELDSLGRIAQVLAYAGRADEAEAGYLDMLRLTREKYGVLSRRFARRLDYCSWYYNRTHRDAHSLEYSKLAARIECHITVKKGEQVAKYLAKASKSLSQLGRWREGTWIKAEQLASILRVHSLENMYVKRAANDLVEYASNARLTERFDGLSEAVENGDSQAVLALLNHAIEDEFGPDGIEIFLLPSEVPNDEAGVSLQHWITVVEQVIGD